MNALEYFREPNEPALLFGFNESEPERFLVKTRRVGYLGRKHKKLLEIAEALLRALGNWKILKRLDPVPLQHNSSWSGLLNVRVFSESYLQCYEFLNDSWGVFPLIDGMICSRQVPQGFDDSVDAGERSQRIFVHVRRGDYLDWPRGASSALPVDYFYGEMDKLRREFLKPEFLVFSDDPAFCREFFHGEDVKIIEAEEATSLKLMSTCVAGILSPSSFSWWGAKLANRSARGPFVAPSDWLNWHGMAPSIEIPRASFLTFKRVSPT